MQNSNSSSTNSPSPLQQTSTSNSAVSPLLRSNSIDSDKFLPQSSIQQLIKDFYKNSSGSVNKKLTKRKRKLKSTDEEEITTSIRVSKETRELLPILANEFIHYITTNAVKICEESDKKTINHEHIVASLKRTNFTRFLPDCEAIAKDATQQAAKRRKNSNRLENSGKSLEELEREQAAMFEEARLAMMAEYEQNIVEAENVINIQQSGCTESSQLPDDLADNDDYD